MVAKRDKAPGFIEFGSPEHAALLGLGDESLRPREKAYRERALAARPVPTALESKRPVNEENYAPRTRYDPGDEIIDGWARRPSI